MIRTTCSLQTASRQQLHSNCANVLGLLETQRYSNTEEVKMGVKKRMLQVGWKFWDDIIYKLLECRETCINHNGNYVEY